MQLRSFFSVAVRLVILVRVRVWLPCSHLPKWAAPKRWVHHALQECPDITSSSGLWTGRVLYLCAKVIPLARKNIPSLIRYWSKFHLSKSVLDPVTISVYCALVISKVFQLDRCVPVTNTWWKMDKSEAAHGAQKMSFQSATAEFQPSQLACPAALSRLSETS